MRGYSIPIHRSTKHRQGRCLPCAVGASVGRRTCTVTAIQQWTPLADQGLWPGLAHGPLTDVDSALETLAGLAQDRVLLMKIDVEGFEPRGSGGRRRRRLSEPMSSSWNTSPQLSRDGDLSVEGMVDRLLAAGFVPHQLAGKSSKAVRVELNELRRIEDQTDILWIKPTMNGGAVASSEPAAQSAG